jgi:hypothetical protein
MNAIDLVFLAAGVAALSSLLLFDKLSRAIVWECFRHPFTPSRIEVKDGKVQVFHRLSPAAASGLSLSEEVRDKP